jgi:ribulose-phosphate 3-epimerase
MEILPSILTNDNTEYSQILQRIEESGDFEDGWIHVDFMDNKFVPNQSVDIDVLKQYPSNLHVEAHLMVQNPEEWVEELLICGVERIIIHIETLSDPEILKRIKKDKVEVGLAIKLDTPIAKLSPFMDTIDLVLVMSINPGFSGQEFIPVAKDRIKEILQLRTEDNNFKVEVDGGVSAELAAELGHLGVDGVIMNSHLLKGDISENLEKIWEKYKENT